MTSAGDGGTRPMPSVGGRGPAVPPDRTARRSPQDEQPTTVIGRVPERRTADPDPGAGPTGPRSRTVPAASRGLRPLELVSGLLGGGVLLAGLVLLVLQFVAPSLVTAGRGPGWAAVTIHLGVGIVAELLRAFRQRLGAPARWLVAALVIGATVGVLFVVWW